MGPPRQKHLPILCLTYPRGMNGASVPGQHYLGGVMGDEFRDIKGPDSLGTLHLGRYICQDSPEK